MSSPLDADVVVIGGGPAGSSAAYWLARAGHSVVLVEKFAFPRDKPCGDALTPRAVTRLAEMGIRVDLSEPRAPSDAAPPDDGLLRGHRIRGLRAVANGRWVEHPWREHAEFGQVGCVIRRSVLDAAIARRAEAAGVRVIDGVAATAFDDREGRLSIELDARSGPSRLVARAAVLADGAHSKLSRQAGITRDRRYVLGIAYRGYYPSTRSRDPYIEIDMALQDRSGRPIAGYGWTFPVGDGTLNIGVGILTTAKDWRSLNVKALLDCYIESLAERWELTGREPLARPMGGRLPLAGGVSPLGGQRFLLAGDAGALNNPFIGEGIGYALETGRLAADSASAFLAGSSASASEGLARAARERYADYFRFGSWFARMLGYPSFMRGITALGVRSPRVMDIVLPTMDGSLSPTEAHAPERFFSLMKGISRVFPDSFIYRES